MGILLVPGVVQDAEAAYKKNPTAENNTKLEQEILRLRDGKRD